MNLPFGLKQKPLRHYFVNGSFSFECNEGKLYAILRITTKTNKTKFPKFEVISKYHLDDLLNVKSLDKIPSLATTYEIMREIPTIEEVVN